MTPEQAKAIVTGVTTCHKQFKPRLVECVTHKVYTVRFPEVSVDPRTVCKWFADAGGYVYQIGTDVGTGEMYLYFMEVAA